MINKDIFDIDVFVVVIRCLYEIGCEIVCVIVFSIVYVKFLIKIKEKLVEIYKYVLFVVDVYYNGMKIVLEVVK